jgi:hypothetical protein
MYTLIPISMGWVRLFFNRATAVVRNWSTPSVLLCSTNLAAVKESVFLPDSRLSYRSASSPVIYQPACLVAKRRQRLCQTISLLINTTNGNCKKTRVKNCFVLARSRVISGIMYRTRRSLSKIIPFRAKQDTSTSRRGLVRPVGAYFPDNHRRSVGLQHYPLHISCKSMPT